MKIEEVVDEVKDCPKVFLTPGNSARDTLEHDLLTELYHLIQDPTTERFELILEMAWVLDECVPGIAGNRMCWRKHAEYLIAKLPVGDLEAWRLHLDSIADPELLEHFKRVAPGHLH